MVTETKPRSLVIVQLSGGNDALNTVIPYGDGLYYDWRKEVRIEQDRVLKINNQLGLNPALRSIKNLWDHEKVAVINGVAIRNLIGLISGQSTYGTLENLLE